MGVLNRFIREPPGAAGDTTVFADAGCRATHREWGNAHLEDPLSMVLGEWAVFPGGFPMGRSTSTRHEGAEYFQVLLVLLQVFTFWRFQDHGMMFKAGIVQ